MKKTMRGENGGGPAAKQTVRARARVLEKLLPEEQCRGHGKKHFSLKREYFEYEAKNRWTKRTAKKGIERAEGAKRLGGNAHGLWRGRIGPPDA